MDTYQNAIELLLPVNLDGLDGLSTHAKGAMFSGKTQMIHPNGDKSAPLISIADLAIVFDIEYDKLRKRLKYKGARDSNVPTGWMRDANGDLTPYDGKTKARVLYQLTEIPQITQALFPEWKRPEDVPGTVITICNYKGGVTKSTTTLSYAQCLSLRGYRVLVIDLDPQGTSTKWLTTRNITRQDCCVDIFARREGSLRHFILPSYWPGIDFIPAHQHLQSVESHFHNLLKNDGPEAVQYFPSEVVKLRNEYDVILIDTPPSLNNLTLSAMFSSDGLVMPLVPSNPDIESASDFWKLYIDTCRAMQIPPNVELFKFIRILISRADFSTTSTANMINWINNSYPDRVFEVRIPKSAAVSRAADSFGTVFDDPPSQVAMHRSAKTGRDQMRSTFSKATEELTKLIWACWTVEQYRAGI